jgi:hypothetical protein
VLFDVVSGTASVSAIAERRMATALMRLYGKGRDYWRRREIATRDTVVSIRTTDGLASPAASGEGQ